jgi:hypothetical protein
LNPRSADRRQSRLKRQGVDLNSVGN